LIGTRNDTHVNLIAIIFIHLVFSFPSCLIRYLLETRGPNVICFYLSLLVKGATHLKT